MRGIEHISAATELYVLYHNFISTCGERKPRSSIDTLAYVFLGNHLDAAMFPRNGLLISRFRSCLDDMCAIIYANQSCPIQPIRFISREGTGEGEAEGH